MEIGKGPVPPSLLERPPRCPNCGEALLTCRVTMAVGQEPTWSYQCAARVCRRAPPTPDGDRLLRAALGEEP